MTKVVRARAKQKNKREGILVNICVYLVAVVAGVVAAAAGVNIEEIAVILESTRKTFRLARHCMTLRDIALIIIYCASYNIL